MKKGVAVIIVRNVQCHVNVVTEQAVGIALSVTHAERRAATKDTVLVVTISKTTNTMSAIVTIVMLRTVWSAFFLGKNQDVKAVCSGLERCHFEVSGVNVKRLMSCVKRTINYFLKIKSCAKRSDGGYEGPNG